MLSNEGKKRRVQPSAIHQLRTPWIKKRHAYLSLLLNATACKMTSQDCSFAAAVSNKKAESYYGHSLT